MIAGNFVNQPVVRRLNHRVHGTLPNAERIDKQGLFFGNDGRDLYDDLSLLGTLL
jgi:CDP-6-deoxy-D-xylo-4-hexulose-3-dehydrase